MTYAPVDCPLCLADHQVKCPMCCKESVDASIAALYRIGGLDLVATSDIMGRVADRLQGMDLRGIPTGIVIVSSGPCAPGSFTTTRAKVVEDRISHFQVDDWTGAFVEYDPLTDTVERSPDALPAPQLGSGATLVENDGTPITRHWLLTRLTGSQRRTAREEPQATTTPGKSRGRGWCRGHPPQRQQRPRSR